MEQSHINKAYDLLRMKNQIDELFYYLTDEDNKLQEIKFVVKTKNGSEINIHNVPIALRNTVKNTVVKGYKAIIERIDEEIASL